MVVDHPQHKSTRENKATTTINEIVHHLTKTTEKVREQLIGRDPPQITNEERRE